MTDDQKKPDPEFNYILPAAECEMIYRILGREPDLDPCGHPDQLLRAGSILYGDPDNDDGMMSAWAKVTNAGSVVVNPPHGERKPEHVDLNFKWYPFSRWMMKCVAEAQRGSTILAFLPASTDRIWFHQHVPTATSICFLQRRVKCMVPDGSGSLRCGDQPKTPQAYALWTSDFATSERFYEELSPRGFVADPNPVDPPAGGGA